MREKQSVRKDIWYLARRKRFKNKTKKGQGGAALP